MVIKHVPILKAQKRLHQLVLYSMTRFHVPSNCATDGAAYHTCRFSKELAASTGHLAFFRTLHSDADWPWHLSGHHQHKRLCQWSPHLSPVRQMRPEGNPVIPHRPLLRFPVFVAHSTIIARHSDLTEL